MKPSYLQKCVFIDFGSPTCSTLELRNKPIGPRIGILREISSLEPAPKVCKPKSRSKHVKLFAKQAGKVYEHIRKTSPEQFVNKSGKGTEQVLKSAEQVLDKSWTSPDQVLKKSGTSAEQVMNKSWNSPEHVVNKSWTIPEEVLKKFRERQTETDTETDTDTDTDTDGQIGRHRLF